MNEPIALQQIITIIIALIAIVISIISLHRTSRVQEQQFRLQKKQEELTDLQLEALRRQTEAREKSISPSNIIQERADVRVDLERVGRSSRFVITNWGNVPARDVNFDLELDAGKTSPFIKGDYDVKIPIPELAPGSRVPIIAAINLSMDPAFTGNWSWKNPDGTIEYRKSMLAL
jgi:hypothetical protein